jgi:arginine deiminase
LNLQYNKLRSYRTRVNRLENDLQEQMRNASSAKNQYMDWNSELQQKMKELREEKKSWISEAAALRGREKELQVRFIELWFYLLTSFVVGSIHCPRNVVG